MKTFYRVAQMRGIPVRIHYTWIIALLIGGWFVSARVLVDALPALSSLEHLVLVVVILALSFASVLLHELGHYAAARVFGLRMRTITLYPFGGVPSQLDQRAGSTKAIWIAAAGPVASLVLWGGLTLLSAVGGLTPQLRVALEVTAQVNLVLALVNLLPGLPLDGGRVVRAIAWQWTLGYPAASAAARKAGQVIAYGLIFFGAWLFLTQEGGLIALLMVFLGWMMREAGSVNQQRELVDQMLTKLTAADAVEPVETSVSPEATLRQVYTETLDGQSARSPIMVVADDRFLGMLTMRAMLDVPQGTWDTRTVDDVMLPAPALPQIAADTPISGVIPHYARVEDADGLALPVVEDGRLLGLIDPRRMDALLELEDALALYGTRADADTLASPAGTSLRPESGAV
jgi:Zn-dependent protease